MWDNREDARMRIAHSVVTFGASPVWVKEITEDLDVRFWTLGTEELLNEEASIDSPNWDWSPVKTGFCNMPDRTLYVQRQPIRRWKQGLNSGNICVSPDYRGDYDTLLMSTPFFKTMIGEFPAFEEVLHRVLKKEVKTMAFDRHFAIDRSGLGLPYLVHRTKRVGWWEAGELRLGDEFQYLQEEVKEAMEGRV